MMTNSSETGSRGRPQQWCCALCWTLCFALCWGLCWGLCFALCWTLAVLSTVLNFVPLNTSSCVDTYFWLPCNVRLIMNSHNILGRYMAGGTCTNGPIFVYNYYLCNVCTVRRVPYIRYTSYVRGIYVLLPRVKTILLRLWYAS